MEQTVAERPLSQDQGVSQLHLHRNGTLNSSGTRCENDPSERWYPRRWTGSRGTLSSGPFAFDRFRQDRSPMAVCRDNLRGSCARGASCKYQHSDPDRHDGSKFYRNEPENLVAVANSGNSQLYRASVNDDSRTRFSSRGCWSRSPCRRFQNGRCFNGTSCPYLHSASSRTYDSTLEQQQVDRAVRDPGFGEGNRDNTLRMTQQCDEANKENSFKSTSFSGERTSRSPCRNFLRGRCKFGASCKRLHVDNALGRSRYDLSNQHHQGVASTSSNSGSGQGSRDVTLRTPQVHEEVTMHNNLRTGAFSREPRNRSPCRNFLSGKCYRGASCLHLHPVTVYDRTRYDSWSAQQHQHQGVSATLRTPNIDDSCRDMHVVSEQKKAWSTRDDVQFAGYNEVADVESRSWSSERRRSRSAIDFGGDKLIREVCLQFTKGRCNRGELCRYLHGYHAYASSNWNKPIAKAAGDVRNDRGTNQHANTMMAQEHDDVKNYKTSLGNSKRTESSLVSSDGCLDKETIGRSVCDTVELKIHDQKGDASAMDGSKCEIPGENIVNNHCSAEGQEDISLWSRPFKRQWSRSPYVLRDEFHCRNRMKFDSRVDLRRDRCYNVARFQYPDRRSYKYERPFYHANSLQRLRGESALVNPSSYEGKNYKSVAPERHDEVTSQGLQLDQGPRGSLGSNIVVASEKNEAAFARCVLQPSHTERNDEELANDSIAVGSTERAAAIGQEVLESDLTHSCVEDHISPTNIDLTMSEKEGNAVMTMEMCLESNEKTVELMPTIKTYSRKKSKKKLPRSVSPEETIKEGVNNALEQMPTSSLAETSSSKPISDEPADIETSASENKKKKKDRKRKKKISESVSCETMKEEVIDAPKQGMSSSSLVETSLSNPAKKRKKKCKNKHSESVSCNKNMNEEVTNASKQEMSTSSLVAVSLSASKNNDSENMLMHVRPVKPQGNGCMTNVTVDNVESVLATKELLVGNAHSHSVQSLPKSLAPNASKKLLVLDVNGLLADIVACYSRQFKPDTTVSAKGVFKRPFCDDFLKFCFLKFNVGIWSSRTRKNVIAVVDFLMKTTKQHLLFCWDQSHCTTTGYKTLENMEKPLVLKELKYLWDSEEENCPWEKRFYNETNTVLLDDSPYKALRNPPNTAIFPYPYTYENVEDKSLGPGGDLRVYLERLAEAENVQKFIQENPFGQEPITKSHKSWSFYSKIVGTYASEQEENVNITPDL